MEEQQQESEPRNKLRDFLFDNRVLDFDSGMEFAFGNFF